MIPQNDLKADEAAGHPLDCVVMVARGVDDETGKLTNEDGCSTNWTPVPVEMGDELVFAPGVAGHQLHFYQELEDEKLAATYCYDDESNWTAYAPGLSQLEWGAGDMTVSNAGFVRVMFQTEEYAGKRLGDYMQVKRHGTGQTSIVPAFSDEIERVVERVHELRDPQDCVLLLMTDIHHSVGDYWEDTVRNIRVCAGELHPDAIIQLGDVTDGIAPRAVTEQLVNEVVGPLRQLGAPLLGCTGNHDVNYFRGNAELMDAASTSRMCLGRDNPDYIHDIPRSQLRLVFIDSFDPNRDERYGYSRESVKWLGRTLRQTPRGWRVLVFSHVPPVAEHHYWSDVIENGPRLIKVLERFNRRRGGAVLGLIHGHNHADQIYHADGFPIISIGCAKYEYFKENKPYGAITPDRERGMASQDLWDVVVAKPASGRLEFIRFGAGDDRSVGS